MTSAKPTIKIAIQVLLLLAAVAVCTTDPVGAKEKKKRKADAPQEDPFAQIVFPPPPAPARIKLEHILDSRINLQGKDSKWKRTLLGATPQAEYDFLKKPIDVALDTQNRVIIGRRRNRDPQHQQKR